MKILSSDLSMEATKGHTDVTRLGISQKRQYSNFPTRFTLNLPETTAESATGYQAESKAVSTVSTSTDDQRQQSRIASQQEFARELVQTITGYEADVERVENSEDSEGSSTLFNPPGRPVARFYRVGNQPFKVNVGVVSTRVETESLQVSSSGSVQTADGREINFSLDLSMQTTEISRSFSAFSAMGGRLIDPIVLNFDSGLDMLEDDFAFAFDLDCDGEDENICALTKGTGFLALDKNNDDLINDGSELFGPLTGSGYGELAAYDSDNNNWIDENDPIFEQLMVWMGAGSPTGELLSLKEAGVGAISLAHVSGGHFSLKNDQGQVMATVDSSGLFLTEDGAVHSMQELDLLARDEAASSSDNDVINAFQDFSRLQQLQERLRQHRRNMVAAMHKREQDELSEAQRESWLQKRFWQWNDQINEEQTG